MNFRNYKGVVPWYNPEQFRKVYRSLYSRNLADQRWAVDQVSVWETRCHPALPTAIEATVVIVRAIIHDTLFKGGSTFCQENEIQMFYAMGLIRFINLVLELNQKSNNKIPLAVIAKSLCIPDWIVGLRNYATHSYLPTLPVLRKGAKAALDYLDRSFWQKEAENVQSFVKVPDIDEAAIAKIIKRFQTSQYERLYMTGSTKVYNKAYNEVFKNLKKLMKCYREAFIEILVQPDLFILSEEDLVNVLPESSLSFLDDDNDYELPKALIVFWLPVIRVLHTLDLMPDFVEMLLLGQNDEMIYRKQAIAWVMKIIQTAVFLYPPSQLAYLFARKGVSFNWKRILYACTRNPCKFTSWLILLVSTCENVQKERFKPLVTIVSMSQGQITTGYPQHLEDRTQPFTLAEAKKRRAIEDKIQNNNPPDPPEENIWSIAPDDIEYHKLPIGAIINPLQENGSKNEDASDESMEVTDDIPNDEICEFSENFIIVNENDSEEILAEGSITVDENIFQEGETTSYDSCDLIYQKREKQ